MNASALAWLTWRQHRWTIIGTAVVSLLAGYNLVSTNGSPGLESTMPLGGFYGLMVQVAFGALIGMFWGAPLIARELEERTYFVAWGQDVTPVKWLRGKLIVLGTSAAVLAVPVGLGDGYRGDQTKHWAMFEASPVVQVGYAVLGLGIGVLAGLLARHTLTAMAATLVFFTATRMTLAIGARDHYLPAKRSISRWDQTTSVPHDALQVVDGFVGADLKPVPVIEYCQGRPSEGSCMRSEKAAVGTYADYQPADRIGVFQLIEFGICVLLAALAIYLAFRLLRHGGGWRPSRSHRRDVSTQSAPATVAVHAEG